MGINRRDFLAGASAFGALGLGGLSSPLPRLSGAMAADTSGYKALVCVFLLGGLDNYDTLFPFDQPSFDRYADIRRPLLDLYSDAVVGGSTRDRSRLLELAPSNASDFGGRQFALPEQLSGVKGLFDDGTAAVVANVGPLIRPLGRAEFEEGSVATPTRLFSHNDQQSTWQASAPEGAQLGWGGRFADAALNSGAAASPNFLAITGLGNEVFLTGDVARPYQVGLEGPNETALLEFYRARSASPTANAIFQGLEAHFDARNFRSDNIIERDFASAMGNALEVNAEFTAAIANASPIFTTFPETFLASQLRAVADTISVRSVLGVSRQIFFVAIGGFDTHSDQVADLPALQSEIDGGVTAFFAAMQELGLQNDVTLFTASDFGRTLAINGDGTDHGWGGHHFVVGGAVQGGRIVGDVPPFDFGHDQDAGGGRLIPTIAVEQYAAALGAWFGLTDAELAAALPNLNNFPSAPLGLFS